MGRFLRLTGLDQLQQSSNVVAAQISLLGWMAPVWAMKKQIVIVDHHAAVRELLCHYLERLPEACLIES